ncbi:unnamed protein product, partial [Candidula unifasciata]
EEEEESDDDYDIYDEYLKYCYPYILYIMAIPIKHTSFFSDINPRAISTPYCGWDLVVLHANHHLLESNIDTYKRMYAYMKDRPHVMAETYQQGIERVRKGNYAFFMENLMIDYQVQRDCELMQVGGQLDSKGYGVGLPMNSPYRDKLSMAILELQEGGVIQMLYNKWWKDTSTCIRDDTKESKANALGVENVGGIFVVLLVGLALAVVVAMLEFIYKSKENAHEGRASLCTEIIRELRFAIRCGGSSKRLKNRNKTNCTSCQHTKIQLNQSPNGVLQPPQGSKHIAPVPSIITTAVHSEPDYGREHKGDYLQVDCSDHEV